MSKTATQTVAQITDQLQAVERAHRRTGKLLEKLHASLAQAVADHGGSVGISPASVAPKD
jgi:hypothetical protein